MNSTKLEKPKEEKDEGLILKAWIKAVNDGFVPESSVIKFFQHYAPFVDHLDLNQHQFNFWYRGFQNLIKQTSNRSEEVQKLEQFIKDRMISEAAVAPIHSDLIHCGMLMTINCFRARIGQKTTTGDYVYNEPVFDIIRRDFGSADIKIAKNTATKQPATKEELQKKEGHLLKFWMFTAKDRFLPEKMIERFFNHYKELDISIARQGMDFWYKSFKDLIEPFRSKEAELIKLERFVKLRLMSEFALQPEHLNLVNCAMKMTVNCFRNRVYELTRTGDDEAIGSVSFAMIQALGFANTIIQSYSKPFIKRCVEEMGGKSLEERLEDTEKKIETIKKEKKNKKRKTIH